MNYTNFKNIEHFTENDREILYKRIAHNVKRLRKKHNITQMELANLLGHKSTSLVSGAEIYYNKQHFSLEHLCLISYILDEDIKEFFQ